MTLNILAQRLWNWLRPIGWTAVALAMVAPAVAMNFTDAVMWTTSDFVFAGIVLIGGAGLCELFAWRVREPIARLAFGFAMAMLIVAIWAWAVG